MKFLKICIGSNCYIKGSEEVAKLLNNLIEEFELKEHVKLQASFCLENCAKAVSLMRWDGKILSVSKENVREVFKTEIIPYL